jgi:hypothetical protein
MKSIHTAKAQNDSVLVTNFTNKEKKKPTKVQSYETVKDNIFVSIPSRILTDSRIMSGTNT